jgi:glycosyltransferase involved in cell wall biosynthesis
MISVIIPAYNVEPYVGEAIGSILEQTYKDIEVVIVDDCSSDNTYQICKKYAEKDQRIRLLRNDVNSGIAVSLNKALIHASGDYIVRMDADDISLPYRIEVMHRFLLDNPNVDIVGSSTITIDEAGHHIGQYIPLINHDDLVKTVGLVTPLLHIWMCRLNVYREVGEYRFPPVEDYDFMLRSIKKGFILHNIREPLYKVRLRGGNTADLYGFRQLKAFEMAHKAYVGGELNSLSHLNIKASSCAESLFQLSRVLYRKGVVAIYNKNKPMGCFWLCLSALVSSYQMRYLLRRAKLSIYKWRTRNA